MKQIPLTRGRRNPMNVNELFVALSNITKDICSGDMDSGKREITAEEWKQIGERFMTLVLMNRKAMEDKDGNTSDRSDSVIESRRRKTSRRSSGT
jgi:hypothetical protein